MKNPKLELSGFELFEIYTSERNEYSQSLFTAHSIIGDELFIMLEQAEKQQKRVVIKTVLDDVDDPVMEVVIE